MPRKTKFPESSSIAAPGWSSTPIAHVARDLGIPHETLRKWVRKTDADEGKRTELLSSEERECLKTLERENRELRRANEILKSASALFAAELDPSTHKVAAAREEAAMHVRLPAARLRAARQDPRGP